MRTCLYQLFLSNLEARNDVRMAAILDRAAGCARHVYEVGCCAVVAEQVRAARIAERQWLRHNESARMDRRGRPNEWDIVATVARDILKEVLS